jgi:hypothetical protein
MRGILSVVVVGALAAHASADSRITQLIAGYEKEATGCQTHADGVAKVQAGGKTLLAAGPDEAVAADVEKLDAGHAAVQAYCDELKATLDMLRADPNASYKSLEKQIDDHDNKIRKLRQSSKKTLDELAPVIQRMIPKMTARRTPAATDKNVPGKFPSGRTVELPSLPGTWKVSGSAATDTVEYTDKTMTASVSVRPFSSATCDQQRKAIASKSDHLDDVAATDATKSLKLAWNVSYVQKGRVVQIACVAGKSGGWLATIDAPIDAKIPLGTVMARMLAAQIAAP